MFVIQENTMEDLQRTLATYAYNILGSMEDARDVVQDVLEKYIGMDPSQIEDARNYLIKAAINHAINLKKRKAYESTYGKWLPEPVEVHTPDSPLIREQTASYSLLVLMEKLNPLERAVFILKEGFGYRHREIAQVLDIRTDHSRQLFLRAGKSLQKSNFKPKDTSPKDLEAYIRALTGADLQKLESLLLEDVKLMTDGGRSVKIVSSVSDGARATAELLQNVYGLFLDRDDRFITQMNHLPALVFHREGLVHNCQIMAFDGHGISRLYSIVDPQKLKSIQIP